MSDKKKKYVFLPVFFLVLKIGKKKFYFFFIEQIVNCLTLYEIALSPEVDRGRPRLSGKTVKNYPDKDSYLQQPRSSSNLKNSTLAPAIRVSKVDLDLGTNSTWVAALCISVTWSDMHIWRRHGGHTNSGKKRAAII
jgi:hypothetical protein